MTDSAELAKDQYMRIFNERLINAVDHYKRVYNTAPEIFTEAFEAAPNKPNCIKGYSESQCAALNGNRLLRRVNTAYRDVLIHLAMIQGVENGTIQPYQLGAIGYQILGLPVPEQYRHNMTDMYSG